MTEETQTGGEPRDDPLTILLVEDNPGDARYIEEIFHDADELTARTVEQSDGDSPRSNEGDVSEPVVIHETRLDAGIDRLSEAPVDVVLLDLNLPDSRGLETVTTFHQHVNAVPLIVLTGLQDRQLGMDALAGGADEYLVKDEINADLLIRSVFYAINSKANERELEQQRDQLAMLNALNDLVQEISHLAIESSSREELEQSVCDTLAESASYRFAWIGEIDRDRETVSVRSEGSSGESTADITIPVGGDGSTTPTVQAFRAGEPQFVQSISADTAAEAWQELAQDHGISSVAAIPITYQKTPFGVLHLATDRRDAFEADERRIIARLGQVIGHAINAMQRKQALMSREVVELRFQIEGVLADVDVQPSPGGTISFDRTVQVSDEVFLQYGSVTSDAVTTLQQLVEERDQFESLSLLDEDGETRRFELRLNEPPAISTIAAYGGRVVAAVIEEDKYRMTVHVPPSADVSRVVEAIQADFANATLVAQRQLTRNEEPTTRLDTVLEEQLTEKQRAAIESAYFSGFFSWPRDSSGEEVAESLDISPSTFHQHVRMAENKLFGALFEIERERS